MNILAIPKKKKIYLKKSSKLVILCIDYYEKNLTKNFINLLFLTDIPNILFFQIQL